MRQKIRKLAKQDELKWQLFVQKLYFDRLEICVSVMCRVAVQMSNECIWQAIDS